MIFCFLVVIFFFALVLVFHNKLFYSLSINLDKKNKLLPILLRFKKLTYLYYLILNDSPNVIIAVDREKKVIFFNSRAEEVFEVKKEEVLGKDYESFLQKHSLTGRSILLDSLKYQKVFEIENYPVKIGNREKRFWGKSYPLFNPKGEVIGAVLVFWDTKGKHLLTSELINQEKFSVVKTGKNYCCRHRPRN